MHSFLWFCSYLLKCDIFVDATFKIGDTILFLETEHIGEIWSDIFNIFTTPSALFYYSHVESVTVSNATFKCKYLQIRVIKIIS